MLTFLQKKIFGTNSDKSIKSYMPLVNQINALESSMANLDQDGCQQKTAELKTRFQNGQSLDELLPEAFALVRRAAQNNLGQRNFDVPRL